RPIALGRNVGVKKLGLPNQVAFETEQKSIGVPQPTPLANSQYRPYAIAPPASIGIRLQIPGANTVTMPTAKTVIRPMAVANPSVETFLIAIGARLRPITATTAPVTTGGISFSTHRWPARTTAMPINVYRAPAAMMPPSAMLIRGLTPGPT